MKNILTLTSLILINACASEKHVETFKSSAFVINHDKVIAYFARDVLPENRMYEIVDTLNLGIKLVNELISGSSDWQMYGDEQLTYNFKPGYFVSHATKSGEINIPVVIYSMYGQSPWLHETLHILLRSKKGNWWPISLKAFFRMPQWFTEGMAEYLAMKISYDHQLPKLDLFDSGGYITVDSICSISLKGENSKYILNHIGEPGIMIKLHGKKRYEYAPAFYNCSCSFTKYLTETYGLDILIKAYSDYQNEHKTIEELTGKTMKELKAEWLLEIN